MRGGGNSVISGDCSNFSDSTGMGSAKLPRRAVSDSWGAYRFDCLVPHIIIQMYIDI
jgi:hypothetical protein